MNPDAHIRSLTRKILSEAEVKTIQMPELGYELRPSNGGQSWSIIDIEHIPGLTIPNYWLVGYLTAHGKLNFNYSPREDRNRDWDNTVDFTRGPEQAARFVWLQRQQPIQTPVTSELEERTLGQRRTADSDDMKDFRILTSQDVKGWVAHIVLDHDSMIEKGRHGNQIYSQAVYIYDDKGDYVGSITYFGGYRMVGSYEEHERGKFNYKDDNSIRQAIRFMFLITQKPLRNKK